MDQQQMPNIDLKNTESVEHKNGKVWAQGFVIRKISKFVAGTPEDAFMPIPVFYNPADGEIFQETLPKELRDETGDNPLRVVE
jgi:hypothetical protein|tara:strand:+ start:254 stop:502 length:249 start_codon:yes stop_codon:yes gene_type:complete